MVSGILLVGLPMWIRTHGVCLNGIYSQRGKHIKQINVCHKCPKTGLLHLLPIFPIIYPLFSFQELRLKSCEFSNLNLFVCV